MKIEVFYIYPKVNPARYFFDADKFFESLALNSAPEVALAVKVIRTDASNGKDIGAYIKAARTCDADIMVCLGSHVRINKDGWLGRIVEVWEDRGPGLYGPFGSEEPIPHIRTTAFWCAPGLLGNYPWEVVTDQDRYNFELDKKRSITSHALSFGMPVRQVTKSRSIELGKWDAMVSMEDLLMLDRFTDMQVEALQAIS